MKYMLMQETEFYRSETQMTEDELRAWFEMWLADKSLPNNFDVVRYVR